MFIPFRLFFLRRVSFSASCGIVWHRVGLGGTVGGDVIRGKRARYRVRRRQHSGHQRGARLSAPAPAPAPALCHSVTARGC